MSDQDRCPMCGANVKSQSKVGYHPKWTVFECRTVLYRNGGVQQSPDCIVLENDRLKTELTAKDTRVAELEDCLRLLLDKDKVIEASRRDARKALEDGDE